MPIEINVGMLAWSTSGIAHYPAMDDFIDELYADPFRRWTMPEILSYPLAKDLSFPSGTAFEFSDTGFLLLARILQRVSGKPLSRARQAPAVRQAGNGRDAAARRTASSRRRPFTATRADRGIYEDTIGWSASWIRGIANTTLDHRRPGQMGAGLSAREPSSPPSPTSCSSASTTSGSTPSSTPEHYYAMGSGVANDWIWNNPHVTGYKGMIGYLPSKDIAIVVFVTDGPQAAPGNRYDTPIYNRIGEIVAPDSPPDFPLCTSGC